MRWDTRNVKIILTNYIDGYSSNWLFDMAKAEADINYFIETMYYAQQID